MAINRTPSHHTQNGYRNPSPEFVRKKVRHYLRWFLFEREKVRDELKRADYPLHPVLNDGRFLRSNKNDFTVTWIGHSTLLFQLEGINILTDPIWSGRASPVSFAGPKRYTYPSLELEDLPAIDVVLITHDHYDHLDKKTIRRLGNKPFYLVPLGVGEIMKRIGVTNFHEMDWWEKLDHKGLEFVCAPAQHFSSRTLFDRNRTLWCSWAIKGGDGSIFFCGDTGYFKGFHDIGERLGPFDLVCLPIGAYLPRVFMNPIHMSPREALRAYHDLRGVIFLPTHWGTYDLAAEPPELPPRIFLEELEKHSYSRDRFWLLKHCETRVVRRANH